MENLKLIVTGTGRCGTVFFAKWLTSIGIPCGHEGIFDHNVEEIIFERINEPLKRVLSTCSIFSFNNEKPDKWVNARETVADSSYLAVPYLNHDLIKDVPIIHVVRNPLPVISSFLYDFYYFHHNNKTPWENIIWKELPELIKIPNNVEKACWFYYRWNQLIEEKCKNRSYLKVNIENFDRNEVCKFAGGNLELIPSSYNNTKSNTKYRIKNLLVNDLPQGEIKKLLLEKSIEYGYDLKSIKNKLWL